MNITTFNPAAASAADILAAQKFLGAAGYYKGNIDGQFYSQSKDALRRYLTDRQPQVAVTADHHDNLADAVLELSRADVGLYEIQSNAAWAMQGTADRTQGRLFRAALMREGWSAPESYCAGAAKAWWHRGFDDMGRDFSKFAHLLTLGSVETYHRAVEAGMSTLSPAPGDIGCMQMGDTEHGHEFVVRAVRDGLVLTREANTSPAPGSPQEDSNGGCVTDKSRVLSFKKTSGLHILGFIRLPV